MAHVKLDVEHGLSLEQAQGAARYAVDHYLGRFGGHGLKLEWLDDTHVKVDAAVRGAQIRGTVTVLAQTLHIEADVPMLLLPFKGAAAAAIERETQRWAQHAKTDDGAPHPAPVS